MYKSLILKSIEFNLRIVLSAAMGWTVFLSSDFIFYFYYNCSLYEGSENALILILLEYTSRKKTGRYPDTKGHNCLILFNKVKSLKLKETDPEPSFHLLLCIPVWNTGIHRNFFQLCQGNLEAFLGKRRDTLFSAYLRSSLGLLPGRTWSPMGGLHEASGTHAWASSAGFSTLSGSGWGDRATR